MQILLRLETRERILSCENESALHGSALKPLKKGDNICKFAHTTTSVSGYFLLTIGNIHKMT